MFTRYLVPFLAPLVALTMVFTLSACGEAIKINTSTFLKNDSHCISTQLPNITATNNQINRSTISLIHSDLVANNFINAQTPLTYHQGESVELMLYFPNQPVSNITWQQTSGPSVALLSTESKVIAFTANALGDYSFQADFTLNNQPQSFSTQFSVVEPSTSRIVTARLGHAVNEGNAVSLRAFIDDEIQITQALIDNATITWRQVTNASNQVPLSFNSNCLSAFFTAPEVSQDQIIAFEVNINYEGSDYNDIVAVLVEASDTEISTNSLFDSRLATVFPYVADSPYANALKQCAYSNALTIQNSCSFNTLPLLAFENTPIDSAIPSVDDVMAKVLVSHTWMGDRFKAFLENYDQHDDFKTLLKATTAIVISYDIRPSFYHPYTGAIYLDPDDLWLSPDERDTINQAPDFRSEFGNELNFVMPWRYVKNNASVSSYRSLFYRDSREMNDILYPFSALLYHELAHANDFYASSTWANIEREFSVLANTDLHWNNRLLGSHALSRQSPLQGNEMFSLAAINYHGEEASDTEKAYSPEDVAVFFKDESAPQFYNYSTGREDFAMLFDGFMMHVRFGIDRDVAITNQPQGDNISGQDYIVAWGQRGRIGEPQIKPRIALVVDAILPNYTEATAAIDALDAPIPMQVGQSWNDNLAISTIPPSLLQRISAPLLENASNNRAFDTQNVMPKKFKNIDALIKN